MLDIDLDGFLLSTQFLSTVATFVATLLTAIVQQFLSFGSSA